MNILMLSKGMCIFKRFTTCCKRLTLASYELSCDTSIGVLPQKFCYSADRKMVFPQNDTFCASQESLLVWMICCIVCMKITLFLCEPHCVFSEFGLFWNIFHRRGRQIQILFRMNSHMMLQLSCFQKSFVIVLTRKMLFFRMMLFMPPKSACLHEWFVAIFACKWPCSRVHYIALCCYPNVKWEIRDFHLSTHFLAV